MDEANEGPDKRSDKRNRPRAPVLDLKAEETPPTSTVETAVTDEGASAPAGVDSTASPTADTAAGVEENPVAAAAGSASESVEPPPPDAADAADAAGAAPAQTAAEPPAASRRRGGVLAALLSGAVAGGAVAATLPLVLSPRTQAPAERVDLVARLQALEAQVTQNAARPPAIPEARLTELATRAVAGEDALLAVRALEKRVGDLEAKITALQNPPPAAVPTPTNDEAVKALAARIAPLEAAGQTREATIKALQTSLAETRTQLQQATAAATAAQTTAQRAASDATGARAGATAELGKIAERLQAAETTLAGMQQKLTALSAPDHDAAARLAAAAQALRQAVERGEPFAIELAAATALKADAGLLAALQPFAAAGVPSAQALAAELDATLAKTRPSAPAAAAGSGILDRLQASAANLVHIRRTDEAPAANSGDTVTRLRAAARRGDVAAAQGEAARLTAAEAATVQPWLAKMQARAAALDAARKLAQQATERLAAKAAQ